MEVKFKIKRKKLEFIINNDDPIAINNILRHYHTIFKNKYIDYRISRLDMDDYDVRIFGIDMRTGSEVYLCCRDDVERLILNNVIDILKTKSI